MRVNKKFKQHVIKRLEQYIADARELSEEYLNDDQLMSSEMLDEKSTLHHSCIS